MGYNTAPGGPPATPDQRAVTVSSNCIIDIQISQMSWKPGDPTTADLAVKVASLMLDRVGTPPNRAAPQDNTVEVAAMVNRAGRKKPGHAPHK
jgi:hypothetical protein